MARVTGQRALAVVAALVLLATGAAPTAQTPGAVADGLHAPLDRILDTYVRDGLVYYRALQIERGVLDRYVASLDAPAVRTAAASWSRPQQLAFWINAYNAFVLRAVIDAYPIRGRSPEYPASSLRQVPGVFDRQVVRAAGRALTLDALEREVLAPLGDARALLALGRGATGSGRLRSEAYGADRIESQLADAEAEVATRHALARVDREVGEITVTPLFSWREEAFVARYAAGAPPRFERRSPVERAVLGLLGPHLVGAEREFVDANTFRVRFHDFDWSLNDLTGR